MEFHPLADLFPLITGPRFEELKADIRDNGVREPVTLYEGKVLDGRNRWRACAELGIRPPTRTFEGDREAAMKFVASLNLQRRDLDSSVRATIALEIEKELALIAKERMRQGATKGGEASGRTRRQESPKDTSIGDIQTSKPMKKRAEASTGASAESTARGEAARLAGTNPSYVGKAKQLEREAPDLFEKVKSGEIKIPKAMDELNERKGKDAKRPDGTGSRVTKAVAVMLAAVEDVRRAGPERIFGALAGDARRQFCADVDRLGRSLQGWLNVLKQMRD